MISNHASTITILSIFKTKDYRLSLVNAKIDFSKFYCIVPSDTVEIFQLENLVRNNSNPVSYSCQSIPPGAMLSRRRKTWPNPETINIFGSIKLPFPPRAPAKSTVFGSHIGRQQSANV